MDQGLGFRPLSRHMRGGLTGEITCHAVEYVLSNALKGRMTEVGRVDDRGAEVSICVESVDDKDDYTDCE